MHCQTPQLPCEWSLAASPQFSQWDPCSCPDSVSGGGSVARLIPNFNLRAFAIARPAGARAQCAADAPPVPEPSIYRSTTRLPRAARA